MTGSSYEIVVIGSGPAGLSAAARAAELGMSHILLEASDQLALTIQRYQKGKHVMAEPGFLPLRSGISFDAGTREQILDGWAQGAQRHKINVAYRAEVSAITGERGNFEILTQRGASFRAKFIVLAIGVQGNPRLLGAPGQEAEFVQYQLDDPDEYHDETIVVVGAGDAAIENALALAPHNRVYIVNRRDEFARAKEGNLSKISEAIGRKRLEALFNTNVKEVLNKPEDGKPGVLLLATPDGDMRIPVNRIIARLGAIPPRAFVESCGIQFPSDAPAAVPELTHQYESNVPGLYIIGALGGYPLIKQAMNQGYETVEYIRGNPIKPVDHDLLAKKFVGLPFNYDVDQMLDFLRSEIMLFKPVNPLRFRELILESNVFCPKPGEVIFARNDYTDSFFSVVDGWVEIVVDEKQDTRIKVTAGQFFGEMSLISGRRRSATVYAGEFCVLVETPRRSMMRLINSIEEVKRRIDEIFILRAIHSQFAPNSEISDLADLISSAELRTYARGEVLFAEGEEGDELHLVRRGSLTVSRYVAGRDLVLSYVPAGKYVGEMGLLGNVRRTASVRAAVPTETVVMKSQPFLKLLERDPSLRKQVQNQIRDRLSLNSQIEAGGDGGELLSFLMAQGLGEATDVLLIDESLCIRCDNCETACADTHDGTSRLDREAGPTYAQIHVPTSCRHCEHPHCMKDCPPDAISRNASGEVTIADNCIGCGNCESNCPYGVIQMAYPGQRQPSVWSRILFASERKQKKPAADAQKRAVKCDMCSSLKGGPACVRACPTGAAIRTSPENFVQLIKRVN